MPPTKQKEAVLSEMKTIQSSLLLVHRCAHRLFLDNFKNEDKENSFLSYFSALLLMKDIMIEGFSLTIEEGAEGTVKISAIQCESFDFFESGFVTLDRINVSTILLAFKQELPSIKYCLKRSQDTLKVDFMIDLDYLPSFSESIVLQKIIGQEARSKIINNQIKAEVSELETLLSKLKATNHRVQQKNQTIVLNTNQIWEVVLEPGTHLVQISGFLTYDYSQAYYQFENHMNTAIPIQVGIEEAGQKRTVETFNFYAGPEYSYEQPFSFSILITKKQEGIAYANLSKKAAITMANNVYCSNIVSSVSMISS